MINRDNNQPINQLWKIILSCSPNTTCDECMIFGDDQFKQGQTMKLDGLLRITVAICRPTTNKQMSRFGKMCIL